MLFSVFLGMSHTYRGGGMIRVTILMDRLPEKVKIPINHLAQLFSIVYCAILVVGTVPVRRSSVSSRHHPGFHFLAPPVVSAPPSSPSGSCSWPFFC